jgi:hypothetical protein
MATTASLNVFNPPKAATHYDGYSYKVFVGISSVVCSSFWERGLKKFKMAAVAMVTKVQKN